MVFHFSWDPPAACGGDPLVEGGNYILRGRMMKQVRLYAVILTMIFLVPGNGNADTVRLSGKVRDNWWVPVHDAKVTVVFADREVRTNTDESGQYEIILENIITSINSSANNPIHFTLAQNFPNPFNPSTAIHFYLFEKQHVRLTVYSVTGQMVRILVDEERGAGNHVVPWNGMGGSGKRVGTGVYFYRLEAGGMAQTRKMVLLDGGSTGGTIPVSPKRLKTHDVNASLQITISIEASGYNALNEVVTLPVTDGNVSCESTVTRILPEGLGDNDMRYVLGKAVEMALDPHVITDAVEFINKDRIYISTRNVDVTLVPEIPGKTLFFMSPDKVQEKADREGDFPCYSFSHYIQIAGEKITLSMQLMMVVGKNSHWVYLWGGGYTADFIRREDGNWDIRIYNQWISKI